MDLQIIQTLGSTEPVTRDEVKNYLRLDETTADDSLIDGMIVNARTQCERFIKSDIVSKRYEFYLQTVTEDIHLPYAPLLLTRNSSGDLTNFTVESDDETLTEGEGFELLGLDNPKLRIGHLEDSFRVNGRRNERYPSRKVKITYDTKGIDHANVKMGVLCCMAWMYYARDAKMSTNWKSWLAPYRVKGYYGTK